MKSINLLKKLTSILLLSSTIATFTGCSSGTNQTNETKSSGDRYLVVNENNINVLHIGKKSSYSDTGNFGNQQTAGKIDQTHSYEINCDIEEIDVSASYADHPEEYAYDIKCNQCFE